MSPCTELALRRGLRSPDEMCAATTRRQFAAMWNTRLLWFRLQHVVSIVERILKKETQGAQRSI